MALKNREQSGDASRRLLTLLAALFLMWVPCALVSCEEEDENEEEFANWKQTNDSYFSDLYATAKRRVAEGDTSWKIIKNWSKDQNEEGKPEDHVVVHVLKEGTGSGTPLFSDTVYVHYQGRLLPSKSYPKGYVFEQTWAGDYNLDTNAPVKLGVSYTQVQTVNSYGSTVTTLSATADGMTSALMDMHIGDRWEVYIPYQLAYGETDQNAIPGCSVLVFDLTLAAYFHAGQPVPAWK